RPLPQPPQLGCGKTVVADRPPDALEPDDDFVVLSRCRDDRSHFLAKVSHRAGEEIALELEDEYVRLRRRSRGLRLLPVPAELPEVLPPHHAGAQRISHRVDLLVEWLDEQPAAGRLAAADDGDEEHGGQRDGGEDDETPGREPEYIVEDVHGAVVSDLSRSRRWAVRGGGVCRVPGSARAS